MSNKASYILLIFIFFLSGCKKEENRSLYAELKDIQELSFAEVQIETLGTIKDPDIQFREIGKRNGFFSDAIDWLEGTFSSGTRVGVYSFNTTYRAFIDLGELSPADINIDQKKNFCKITLPVIRVKTLGRDFTLEAVYERRSWYRPEITAKEKERLKNKASEKLREESINNEEFYASLQSEAQRKARIWFTTLLNNRGYNSEISFREE